MQEIPTFLCHSAGLVDFSILGKDVSQFVYVFRGSGVPGEQTRHTTDDWMLEW
jgi:hypothetical protein